MTSVPFLHPGDAGKYRKIQLLKDYVEQTEEVIEKFNVENGIDNSILVNGRRQTNLGGVPGVSDGLFEKSSRRKSGTDLHGAANSSLPTAVSR